MNHHKFVPQSYFRDSTHESTPKEVIDATINEILSLAEKNISKDISQLDVLDVGSGWGEYAFALERKVKSVVGVEPYDKLYDKSIENKHILKSNVTYHKALIEEFETDQRFDLVISLTTVEHMPNAVASFQRIYELLRPGGMVYVTAPNKLWPFEAHYRLFFLSYLPLPLANFYVRLFKRGTSFEDSSYVRTYFGMLDLFRKSGDWDVHFHLPDTNAAYLGCGTGHKNPIFANMRKWGIELIRRFPILWLVSKGFIVVLKKPASSSQTTS